MVRPDGAPVYGRRHPIAQLRPEKAASKAKSFCLRCRAVKERIATADKSLFTPTTPIPEKAKAKASGSFLQKRTKKLLILLSRSPERPRDSGVKVFCFFSSEKKAFLL